MSPESLVYWLAWYLLHESKWCGYFSSCTNTLETYWKIRDAHGITGKKIRLACISNSRNGNPSWTVPHVIAIGSLLLILTCPWILLRGSRITLYRDHTDNSGSGRLIDIKYPDILPAFIGLPVLCRSTCILVTIPVCSLGRSHAALTAS